MKDNKQGRRGFFAKGLKFMGALGAGGLTYSAFRFVSARGIVDNPHIAGTKTGDDIGVSGSSGGQAVATSAEIPVDSIGPGESRIVAIGYIPVIVVRGSNGFKAFNATCSHLGCIVKWDHIQQRFVCPCHAGQYNADGRVVSGPPPRALLGARVEEQGSMLKISV